MSCVEIIAMHIRDLINRTGVAERQVRYLIAEGFIPPPRGGRSNADYGDDHIVAIQKYLRLRDLGFPPAAIKLLLQAREGAPFPVAPGITLVVDPNLLASGTAVDPLGDRLNQRTAGLTHSLRSSRADMPRRISDRSRSSRRVSMSASTLALPSFGPGACSATTNASVSKRR
jgi:DNA-binding transcriptional MerR regulator